MVPINKLVFGNGAGSIKTLEQVKRAAKGPMTRITVGSITMEPRLGNTDDVYYFHPQDFWSMNSLGLPNIGIEAYGPLWRDMVGIAHDAGKELWASISPFSPHECAEMVDLLLFAGLDGVEINGSCPNIWDGGKRKAIPALDPAAAEEMFAAVAEKVVGVGASAPISFKLSPTRNLTMLSELAVVLAKYNVTRLVCSNTIPDQERMRVDGRPALAFRSSDADLEIKHKGGLAGSAVLEESLFVCDVMRDLIPTADIIGVGGIFNAADAKRYLDLGCGGFQSTTGYLEFKEQLWVDILMGLELDIEAA